VRAACPPSPRTRGTNRQHGAEKTISSQSRFVYVFWWGVQPTGSAKSYASTCTGHQHYTYIIISVYSRVGASYVGRPICVCAVSAPLRRVNAYNHHASPMNMRRNRLFRVAAAPAPRLRVVWSSKHSGTGRVVPGVRVRARVRARARARARVRVRVQVRVPGSGSGFRFRFRFRFKFRFRIRFRFGSGFGFDFGFRFGFGFGFGLAYVVPVATPELTPSHVW
jgi:hypothetical protein